MLKNTLLNPGSALLAITIIILLVSCKSDVPEDYRQEIDDWHNKRIENLTKSDGWLSLAGLYWLKEGENKFGSDPSNDIVFPEKAPAFIGSIFLEGEVVTTKMNPGIGINIDSTLTEEIIMKHDQTDNSTILKLGTFKWYVIKRSKGLGIRLKDSENILIKNFEGIKTYPIDPEWKIKAKFVAYNPPKIILIPNILGTIDESESPGYLEFEIAGNLYRLDAIDAGDEFYMIFGDETNGEETYGAGRFLYVNKPDSIGITYIDFNKTYNPPCVFTKYATCPLPPKQNMLKVEITAGEKNYEGEGH